MSTEMNGIAVAGNILVDKINTIKYYPKETELAEIFAVSRAVGGCVPNVAVDLKTLSPETDVYAVGRIGDDAEGRFVLEEMSRRGVDVTMVKTQKSGRTSFTEVMSVDGGERTFFTYAGVNAHFSYKDMEFDRLQVKMLHLGYLLLLDQIDKGDGLKILQEAKFRGMKTSVDLVSKSEGRYAEILPCLQFTDNLIVNETEAGMLTGISPECKNLRRIAETLKAAGVADRVVIHQSDLSVCLSERGFSVLPSYDLPAGFIKGTTGAGDAFCAGCLLGIYRQKSDREILEFASSSAVAALSEEDSVSGMKSEGQVKQLCKNLVRKKVCL